MTRTRRLTQSLWPWHPGNFPQTLAYLLETGVLCSVDYAGLTICTDLAVILFQRSPAGAIVPLNPSHLPRLYHNVELVTGNF